MEQTDREKRLIEKLMQEREVQKLEQELREFAEEYRSLDGQRLDKHAELMERIRDANRRGVSLARIGGAVKLSTGHVQRICAAGRESRVGEPT